MTDDFYIGYEPEMPASLAPRITAAAAAMVALGLVLAGIMIWAQAGFAEGTFEYGQVRSFEGRVIEHPYPALETTEEAGTVTWYWLVGPGKHGAANLVSGLEGRRVRLSGSRIEREGDRMIEVISVRATSAPAVPVPPVRAIGATTLRGEIVDSKCHLGVMKPGEGPTHRDCAVRCLLGAIPPMVVVRGGGDLRRVPLVTSDGGAFLDALPSLAGRPVLIRGTLVERGGRLFLSATAKDIEAEG